MILGRTPDLDAPITSWTQVSAFDAAKDCENARANHLPKRKTSEVDAIPGDTPVGHLPVLPARLPPGWFPADAFDLDAPGELMALRLGGEWYFTRCVPAEAVYAPKSPAQK